MTKDEVKELIREEVEEIVNEAIERRMEDLKERYIEWGAVYTDKLHEMSDELSKHNDGTIKFKKEIIEILEREGE